MGRLALGEPSWQVNVDGGWDVVPLVIAAVALLLLRVVFAVRLRWYHALAVVLIAPLFRAAGDRIGMPLAVVLALVVSSAVVVIFRRISPPGSSPTKV